VRRVDTLHPYAKHALMHLHYLKRMPQISFAFQVTDELTRSIVGVLTFGAPASHHLQVGAHVEPHQVIELNRLWLDDRLPDGIGSSIVSAALRQLPARMVVSYADTSAGHHGGIYRACNFFYAGWTDMDRKTPRFDYVPETGKHSRSTFRDGGAFTRVRRKPKVRYWTVTGDRRERKQLLKGAIWPRLDWKTLPSPEVSK
jgi:hypothetical protein